MKSVQLKSIHLLRDGKPVEVPYKAELDAIMRVPMNNTADLDELRRSIRILDILETIPDNATEFTLEDADFEYMCLRVKATRWAFIDKALLAFVEDVTKV